MQRWLLNRLFAADQPAPHFAFYGTVNWMRALAILVEHEGYSRDALKEFYRSVSRRQVDTSADTLVFESVFLAFNHLAGLGAITSVEDGYDVCRPAISAWYHCVHSSAAAMLAAASGDRCEGAEGLAEGWQEHLVSQRLVRAPFSLAVSTLVKADAEAEVDKLRGGNAFDLGRTPSNFDEALGAAISYLHGTVKFDRERIEYQVRESEEFAQLGVSDFRTRAARELRDLHLRARSVNFVSEAVRYVGKAGFRDSIFLSYGDNHEVEIDRFLADLMVVAVEFLRMTCTYCSARTEVGTWDEFVSDVEANSQVSLDASILRV